MLIQFQPTLKIIRLDVDESRRRVFLEAAPDGIIAAILRALGVGGASRFTIDASGARRSETRFSGQQRTYCPLQNVAASVFTRSKPIGLLIAAAMITVLIGLPQMFAGEFIAGIIVLVVAAVLAVAYVLSKERATIGVVTNATTAESLKLKASPRELQQLESAAAVIEQLLAGSANADAGRREDSEDWSAPPAGPRESAAPASQPPGTFVLNCANCGSHLRLKEVWRGKTISCPACQHQQDVPV